MLERLLKSSVPVLAVVAGAACGAEPFTSPEEGTGGGATATASAATASSGQGGTPSCTGNGDGCNECVVAACPEYACACLANPQCTGLYECYAGACPNGVDDLCAKYCMNTHPSGISQSVLTTSCGASHCMAQCPGATGPVLTMCQECLYTQCSAEMNACLSVADCYDYVSCTTGCPPGDTGCFNGCAMAHPMSAASANAILACMQSGCASPCFG